MKNSALASVICSFLLTIFASCGSPTPAAKPSRAPLLLGAKKLAKPKNPLANNPVRAVDLFVEGDQEKSETGLFMEVQTGFKEFDTGDDPLSDRYDFSNTLEIGD